MKYNDTIKGYLAPDVILRMLIATDAKSEVIMKRAENNEIELISSVFALFEAVASLEDTDKINLRMFKRILATVSISSEMEDDFVLGYKNFSDKRKKHLRSVAFDGK